MKKMNKKGFTIVELVIVIAVIAILAAVMIPTFSGVVDKANSSKALQQARNLYTEYYALDLGDGIIDCAVDGSEISVEGTYTPVANSAPSFEYTSGSWKVTYDGSEWETSKVS